MESSVNTDCNFLTYEFEESSVDAFDHHRVEVLETDFTVFVAVTPLHHQPHRLLIQVLLNVLVDLSNVVQVEVPLVGSIVFFENRHDVLFALVDVGLRIHRLHKFEERNTTSLLSIELSDDFVDSPLVGVETIFSKQDF